MDDEDLKRVAEAAAEFVGDGPNPLMEYLEAVDPPTVLSLLSRLSAAADRERVLREALRPVARYAARLLPSDRGHVEFPVHVTVDQIREAARALTQEPTR